MSRKHNKPFLKGGKHNSSKPHARTIVSAKLIDLTRSKKSKASDKDWHHRKPRCFGGTSSKENLVRVNVTKHVAHHILYDGPNGKPMRGDKIIEKFCRTYPAFLALYVKPDGTIMTPEEALHQLNTVWNDPDYVGILQEPDNFPNSCE